ncbi:Hypothetical predicted protein [Pelobates cultripes]|uniref:Uncharacterized protein n=1 Tax=Pelobates cultripes TaxID=61616 RepID=A0AAD1RL75_PELCU|nr:Hypothetical predicted protein [Pelobates cultripes]
MEKETHTITTMEEQEHILTTTEKGVPNKAIMEEGTHTVITMDTWAHTITTTEKGASKSQSEKGAHTVTVKRNKKQEKGNTKSQAVTHSLSTHIEEEKETQTIKGNEKEKHSHKRSNTEKGSLLQGQAEIETPI